MAIRTIDFPDAPRFVQSVQLDGRVYVLRLNWNGRFDSWFLDIEQADGTVLLLSVRVVLGYPLLFGFDHDDRLPPGEFFAICPTGRCRRDPSRDSFDSEDGALRFVYISEDEFL